MKIAILIGLVIAIVVVVMIMLRNTVEQSEDSVPSAPPSPGASGSVKKLNWIQGAGGEVEGKTYHIGQRTVTIGRAPTNFVQIMDSSVSRFHVKLTPVGNGLELQDMSSSTGTKVNEEVVSKTVLKSGDTFTIGTSLFIYHREANYTINEGLGRKDVGGEAIKPTLMEEDGAVIDKLVLKALDEYDGDVIKVAQVTNLQVSVVESIRDKHKG